MNDKKYLVQPPQRSTSAIEESDQVGDVRMLVSQVIKTIFTKSVKLILCLCISIYSRTVLEKGRKVRIVVKELFIDSKY